MSPSPDSHLMDCDGSTNRIEVTIHSLHGVVLDNPKYHIDEYFVPEATATVTFSGSSSSMEVCSLMLCSLTGQLMVESLPLCVDTYSAGGAQLPLIVEWTDNQEKGTSLYPHLIVQLPCRDPSLPKAPLSKSNRDSGVIKQVPSLEDTDTQSTVTEGSSSTCLSSPLQSFQEELYIKPTRSGSAIWSTSGAAMPEIIELNVRLKVFGEFSDALQGVAFLVLFGSDDPGTYFMDLPIRKLKRSTLSTRRQSASSIIISEEARLMVKVKIFPQKRRRRRNEMLPSACTTLSSSTQEIHLSDTDMEEQIAPLMEKIRQNEELAREQREAQRRAMDVRVPVPSAPTKARSTPLCSTSTGTGLWSWTNVFDTLVRALKGCHAVSHEDLGVPGSDDSVGSTIATRPSMDF